MVTWEVIKTQIVIVNMNRLYKRPMFRRGGSAEGGITSGLGRPGYAKDGAVKELTTRDRMLQAVGATPRGQNFNDFLINFGLDLGSRSPQGNILQTAAASAKDPYSKFAKANQSEQNLLRQVGLEAEGIDIKNEQDIASTLADQKFKGSQLDKKIQAEIDLQEIAKGDSLQAQIDNEIATLLDPQNSVYNNYNTAKNAATWKYKTSTEYKDRNLGGLLSSKQSAEPKERNKKAKALGRKNGRGTIVYDPFMNIVYEVGKNEENDWVFLEVVTGDAPTRTGISTVDNPIEKTIYEKMTGKKAKPYTYEDMQKNTDETTQKIVDTITTPVDLQNIDTSNIRKYR